MRLALAAASLLTIGLIGTATVAEARDYCGGGMRRNGYGYCVPYNPYPYGYGYAPRRPAYGYGYGYARPDGYGPRWGGPRW